MEHESDRNASRIAWLDRDVHAATHRRAAEEEHTATFMVYTERRDDGYRIRKIVLLKHADRDVAKPVV